MILRLKNITSAAIKVLILRKDGGIENVLVSSKISFGEKTISSSLVTYTMIIKLSHYI